MSCKESDNSFEISGVLSPEVDSIHIYPGFIAKEFIDTNFHNLTSKINKGEFVFKGEMPYPHMMNLYGAVGMSSNFFIEKGNTSLSMRFGDDGDREVNFSEGAKSSTQREYELLKKTKLDPIEDTFLQSKSPRAREEYKEQIDSALIDHLKVNPNSYVVLWLMLDRFCLSSYEYIKSYDEALGSFSNEIKQLDIYKKFKDNITYKKDFSFTNREIPLKDINETDITFNLKDFKDKKYLLIDFWFSNCSPCLKQMPKYKPIYNKHKIKGFEIISISVDESKDIAKWKGLIEEREFNWTHYLDLSGHETKKMKINSYPTTYLIDTKGIVIEKNISPERLEKFLNDSI